MPFASMYQRGMEARLRAPVIILGFIPTDAMTIALLIALAGSLALMAFIVKKLEKAV